MSEVLRDLPPPPDTREEQMFPTFTPEQVERIRKHGHLRRAVPGEVLTRPGDLERRLVLVVSGVVDIVREASGEEQLVRSLLPGQFSGEINMLSGRPGFVLVRARTTSEVIEVERDDLLTLVQTDASVGETFMRAFILRRVELIAHGMGDVVLMGSNHCAATLRVKQFLIRNSHPYSYVDLDVATDLQELLDRFQIVEEDIPVLICGGNRVLRRPSNEEIAACLGFNEAIDETQVRDVVIIGAGPAGLGAAVYADSEGLDVLVLEADVPGGQAGSSSKIENYLGFPTGISGQELTARAYTQAQKFGAKMMVANGATRLACARKPYVIESGSSQRVPSRTVIIATGAEYRKLPLPNIAQFEGVGVYYGATHMEAQLCRDEEVIVIGGGNSAGQAAVFLAETTRRVHMLVRAPGLAETMSRYLIRRIEQHPRIELQTSAEVIGVDGGDHLEEVRWRIEDREVSAPIRHIFVMAGAIPNTHWLEGCVAMDANGFVKTGSDLTPDELRDARWPLARAPRLLETSLPGIFAVGDVRGGNLKRVASAVGEGAIAVALIHQVLHEL